MKIITKSKAKGISQVRQALLKEIKQLKSSADKKLLAELERLEKMIRG
ncbi:MAG: hypothetical protein V1767_02450 [Chloroflexota bacterium]